ncbi:MAG: DEAD/DEAH box helicase family protein [Bacteroidota bacterium]
MIIPRTYQADAIDVGVKYFNGDANYNAIEILPTGSGKSVVIANTAMALEDKTIVFQPSKEILIQNLNKFLSYGYRAGVYSASAGSKFIDKITFATIGSVINKQHLFRDCKNIIIDECHLVNSKGGMYHEFIKNIPGAKVLGMTATPYRLASSSFGAELRFITRTNPRIFNRVLYYIQNDVLFNAGHLAQLEYFNFDVVNRSMLKTNSTGTDFTDASLKSYYKQINMSQLTAGYANRLLAKRKNLLVFCALVAEAHEVSRMIPGSVVIHGELSQQACSEIQAKFLSNTIRCVIAVGKWTTGFDKPDLEALLIAKSTMSLALYYQWVGRIMRPFTYLDGTKKVGWVVDLGGNIKFFGKIETMKININAKGLYSIWNNGRQLTNVPFTKN